MQPDKKTILAYGRLLLISLICGIVIYFGVRYVFPEEQGSPVDPLSTLVVILVAFFMAIMFKIDYSRKLFILNVFMGIALVTFFNFTQGIITIILLLLTQKLLKFL